MTTENPNITDPTAVKMIFTQLIAHIRVAQQVEKMRREIEEETDADFESIANVAAVAWDHAFDLCKDLIEAEPATPSDHRYLIVAVFIDEMFMTEPAYRDELADRAAEQRAEMRMNDEEIRPEMMSALQLLTWPIDVPDTYADRPWPGCAP